MRSALPVIARRQFDLVLRTHEHGNALTSPYLWILTSIGVGPAVVFWQKTLVLQIGCIVFAAAYVYAYVRIVRFRSPRWWSLRRTPPGPTEKP